MGGSSSPSLPDAPSFQENPFVGPNIGFLSSIGQSLARGGFMGGGVSLPPGFENVDLSFLQENVNLNPEITQQAIGLASRDITERAEDFRQQTVNQLEANNQLTSSVANTSLQEINEAFNQDIADVATTFHLADAERALSTRLNLFELGLNTTGQATNFGLSDQSQQNEFALQNYNNQVAASLAGQGSERGGLGGALTGAAGGAAAGSFFGPIGTAIGAVGGGLAGGFGSSGTGQSLFAGGAGALGASRGLGGGGFTPTSQFGTQDQGLNARLQALFERQQTGVA